MDLSEIKLEDGKKLSAKERLVWLTLHLIGQVVQVRTVSGDQFIGLLHTLSSNTDGLGCTLYMARKRGDSVRLPAADCVKLKAGSVAQINATQIHWNQDISVRHTRSNFETDNSISGRMCVCVCRQQEQQERADPM
jgi:Ataxin 2 SM domain